MRAVQTGGRSDRQSTIQQCRHFQRGLPEWKKAGFDLNTSLALPRHDVPTIAGEQFQILVGTACFVDIRTPRLYGGSIDTRSRFGPNVEYLTLEYRK